MMLAICRSLTFCQFRESHPDVVQSGPQLINSDNSTALLLITLVVTLLHNCGSDVERLVLYRFLAEASMEMPEVLSMTRVLRVCLHQWC